MAKNSSSKRSSRERDQEGRFACEDDNDGRSSRSSSRSSSGSSSRGRPSRNYDDSRSSCRNGAGRSRSSSRRRLGNY
jgi:hypothetical protein